MYAHDSSHKNRFMSLVSYCEAPEAGDGVEWVVSGRAAALGDMATMSSRGVISIGGKMIRNCNKDWMHDGGACRAGPRRARTRSLLCSVRGGCSREESAFG